jgi:hypothetical protein
MSEHYVVVEEKKPLEFPVAKATIQYDYPIGPVRPVDLEKQDPTTTEKIQSGLTKGVSAVSWFLTSLRSIQSKNKESGSDMFLDSMLGMDTTDTKKKTKKSKRRD